MYYERTLYQVIKRATNTFPVVLLTGPRQVGKTTLFEKCVESERKIVSLDDIEIRNLAKNDPNLFLQQYKPPVLIDEVQYAPELFPYIKIIVDKEKKDGLFWLTGSQPFELMKNVTESLAGRVAVIEMQGLTQAEKFQRETVPFVPDKIVGNNRESFDINQVYTLIFNGSFPKLIANPNIDRDLFFSSYLKTYIERDIKLLKNIEDEHIFLQFIRVIAARTGQLLNYKDISNSLDITEKTVKAWISLLETSGLIYILKPYYKNLSNRQIKTPKLYFLDTGLCVYLCGWKSVETLQTGAMSGAIFETYVVSEILKSYWNAGKEPTIYFYRDKEKNEIDVIIEQDGTLYPVEIKRTAKPSTSDIEHFSKIDDAQLKRGKGSLVCMYNNLLPLTKEVDCVPVAYI
ncbi:ATPase [Bacteroidia bacterium]|nr:ATPase [Bacteroidia bacterium]GHU66842.1 ATPase [Bacteroidia bacterium]